MPSDMPAWPFLIPIVAIIGGFVLAGLGIYSQIRRREFEHRERLAMIEKGVAPAGEPPPGVPPGTLPTTSDVVAVGEDRETRTRRGGFIVMAVGFGIGFMLWMTSRNATDDAVGIGGFIVILGAAIFLSSFLGSGRGRGGVSGR